MKLYRSLFVPVALFLAALSGAVAAAEPTSGTPGEAIQSSVPREEAVLVELGGLVQAVETLPPERRLDQWVDSVVHGALLASDELDAQGHRDAAWDRPILRDPVHDELMRYEYGPARRIVVGDAAWFFVPLDAADEAALLGRLADRTRMELGEDPGSVVIHRYRLDQEALEARVVIDRSRSWRELFTPAFGYHEQEVRSAADLAEFLERVDDLTWVRRPGRDHALQLGGRRQADRGVRRLDARDVAVLHKGYNGDSEWRGGVPGFSLDPYFDVYGLCDDLDRLAADPASLIENARTAAAADRADPANGGADSTCPSFAAVGATALLTIADGEMGPTTRALNNELRKAVASLAESLRPGERLRQSHELVEFYRFIARFEEPTDEVEFALKCHLEAIRARHEFQSARYDGNLRGTHVGMVLFYTDLIAKVWSAVDFDGSTPYANSEWLRTTFDEFPVEPAFWHEAIEKPSTRMWFSPYDDGFSRTDDELCFDPWATRFFAAGSDPTAPLVESDPSEGSRRLTWWWNEYLPAIAQTEPQYHTLNQVLKWSLVVDWLGAIDQLDSLDSLVPETDLRFDRWMAGNGDLRFKGPIPWVDEARWPDGLESLERLCSMPVDFGGFAGRVVGGVSLAERGASLARPLSSRVVPPAARQSIIHRSDEAGVNHELSGGSRLVTPPPDRPGVASARLIPDESLVRRTSRAEWDLRAFQQQFAREGRQRTVVEAGHGPRSRELRAATSNGRARLRLDLGSDDTDPPLIRTAQRVADDGMDHEGLWRLGEEQGFRPSDGAFVIKRANGYDVLWTHYDGVQAPRLLRIGTEEAPAGTYYRDAFVSRMDALIGAISGVPSSTKVSMSRLEDGNAVLGDITSVSVRPAEPTGRVGLRRQVNTAADPLEGPTVLTAAFEETTQTLRCAIDDGTATFERPPGMEPMEFLRLVDGACGDGSTMRAWMGTNGSYPLARSSPGGPSWKRAQFDVPPAKRALPDAEYAKIVAEAAEDVPSVTRRVLGHAERADLERTAAELVALTPRGPPWSSSDAAALSRLAQAFDELGQGSAAELVRSLAEKRGLGTAVKDVTVAARAGRLVTEVTLEPGRRIRPVAAEAARRMLLEKVERARVVPYVEAGLAGRAGVIGGATPRNLVRLTDAAGTHIRTPSRVQFPRFRPDVLVVGRHRYLRCEIEPLTEAARLHRSAAYTTVLLIGGGDAGTNRDDEER